MYTKILFGLMNASATFQREMDIEFAQEKYKFVVVYMDYITIFSKKYTDHLKHLRIVFERCTKSDISLNINKLFFRVEEGKLLGHIVSSQGVNIGI